MAARVPRAVAKELVQFIKRVEVRANFWDPTAKSAFEFGRQMSSPKLAKLNPQFACSMSVHSTDAAPEVLAEFMDGSKLKLSTSGKTCADLRAALFEKAEDAEEVVERAGGGGGAAASKGADKAGAKGGGDKGGAAKKK